MEFRGIDNNGGLREKKKEETERERQTDVGREIKRDVERGRER